MRLLGVDSEPVNQGWLCDKGRFGYEVVHSEERVRQPMVRKDGELVECSWPEALDAAADGIKRALDLNGPQSIALLGGARGTNEDAYVWARFTKGVLGTDNVDAQLGDGLPADVALGLPDATIADLDRAAAIVVIGLDLKEELPVLYLRVKHAAEEIGVPLIELAPKDQGLTRYADVSIRSLPGEQGETATQLVEAHLNGSATSAPGVADAAALMSGRDGDIVVVLGRGDLAESAAATTRAAAAFGRLPNAKFLVALRRGNVRGALDLGLAPGFLPGRVTLDAGRDWFGHAWGAVPASPGLDAAGILQAAEQGRIHALMLLGTDPQDDFPDHSIVEGALNAAGFTIAIDSFITDSTKRADVFLPVTMWGEKAGSVTNLEGRVQRTGQKVSPDGTAMPDWRIAAELALRLGADFDLEAPEEIQDEIARVAPAYAGIDATLLRRARDGAVAPISEHPDELVLGPVSIPLTDARWEPIRPGLDAIELERAQVARDAADARAADRLTSVAPVSGAPAQPDGYRWVGEAGDAAPPARDAYALRLVTGRTLYDGGITVAASDSLSALVAEPLLLIHPQDRDRIGVEDGAEVRVTSSRGSLTIGVRADAGISIGSAYLPFNLPGGLVNDLVDIGAAVTDLRVESLS